MIEIEGDARGVEVEAVMLLGLKVMVCYGRWLRVCRLVACSIHGTTLYDGVSVNDDVLALVCQCIIVRFGLVSLNMRHILLILIYVGTFLMS
jgi:hypothetical protein